MASFAPDDVLLDIEKLETMLTNSSASSCDSSSTSSMLCPLLSPTARSLTATARFTGSSKVYLRNLNKLLADIEQKQRALAAGGGATLKRLRPSNSSSARPLTFAALFSRPAVKCTTSSRLEPKTISFAQLIMQSSPLSTSYSNHQSEYGCARLNEKMWVVHCRNQLTQAVNDELRESTKAHVSDDAGATRANLVSLGRTGLESYLQLPSGWQMVGERVRECLAATVQSADQSVEVDEQGRPPISLDRRARAVRRRPVAGDRARIRNGSKCVSLCKTLHAGKEIDHSYFVF